MGPRSDILFAVELFQAFVMYDILGMAFSWEELDQQLCEFLEALWWEVEI